MDYRAYRQDRANGRPPWWVWFEPPKRWPGWLHGLTCTHCRGLRRYAASLPNRNPEER